MIDLTKSERLEVIECFGYNSNDINVRDMENLMRTSFAKWIVLRRRIINLFKQILNKLI